MTLVAGIDSSTQACKVVVCDAESGRLLRHGRGVHPQGTEVDPAAWAAALDCAVAEAGGLDDVTALSVGGQQHGMVCLDEHGCVVRPALLWNDTRSAAAASELIEELGGGEEGRRAWVDAVGLVPVASFTVAKLRWLAAAEPESARRTEAVCLPHDWLTWRLTNDRQLGTLVTDRGDASGTGYWSAATGQYRRDLLVRALGHDAALPRVLRPAEAAGETAAGVTLGPGTGDNAAAALGLGAEPGDVVVSIGTSGVACAVSKVPAADVSGIVAGFADATGQFLPLVATLNAARVLDAVAELLDVDHERLSQLALAAPGGAEGLVLVPYLEGERTPNRPTSTGALHGVRLANATAANVARAAVEGLLCGLADAVDALVEQGARIDRVLLIGGGARSESVRRVAPSVFGLPVVVPAPAEYVASGAARQAAWLLTGGKLPPHWPLDGAVTYEADALPRVRTQYAEARDLTVHQRSSD